MPLPTIALPFSPLIYQTPTPIHSRRHARNGLIPHAILECDLANSTNYAAAIRGKQLFHGWSGVTATPSGVTATRDRWRFAAHTSPMLRRLWCKFYVARQDHGTAASPTVTLYITDATAATTYGTATFTFGASAAGASDSPDEFGTAEIAIEGVPADTDIYGRFEDGVEARLIAATVYEEKTRPLASNGYVVPSGVSVNGPIYADRRETMYELGTSLWKRGAAHLINWTVDRQATPRTTLSLTAKNVIDDSSTTVSTSTPGYTIDLRYCRTLGLSTVPCVMQVFGYSGTPGSGGVYLKDSTGAIVATVAPAFTGTGAWYSATFSLPATLAKYDLHYADANGVGDGTTSFSVQAVSIYQHA